jgi:hypothetical protein
MNRRFGNATRKRVGNRKWNKRVRNAIDNVRALTNFDRLYIGGGNHETTRRRTRPGHHARFQQRGHPGRDGFLETEGGYAMNRCIQMLATAALVLLAFTLEARAADVPYISGGAGADARQELLAKERDYNLKIIAADTSGDYLAGVQVVIESARKEHVLDTTMDGPILLAKLPPGTYTIRATSDAKTLTRTVNVAAQGLRQADFRWDVSR